MTYTRPAHHPHAGNLKSPIQRVCVSSGSWPCWEPYAHRCGACGGPRQEQLPVPPTLNHLCHYRLLLPLTSACAQLWDKPTPPDLNTRSNRATQQSLTRCPLHLSCNICCMCTCTIVFGCRPQSQVLDALQRTLRLASSSTSPPVPAAVAAVVPAAPAVAASGRWPLPPLLVPALATVAPLLVRSAPPVCGQNKVHAHAASRNGFILIRMRMRAHCAT